MTFIQTVPPEAASGLLAEHYEADRATFGAAANMTQAFSLQPEVYGAWKQLNAAVKAGMDLRRSELATLAATVRSWPTSSWTPTPCAGWQRTARAPASMRPTAR
jgi:hypothetical protein